MATPEALAIQREHFEREQSERLERIEQQLALILAKLDPKSDSKAAAPKKTDADKAEK